MRRVNSLLRSPMVFWTAWACSALLFIWSAWPGWLSNDSIAMFREASAGQAGDWYPPALTYLWSLMAPDQIGPIGPLLIQASMFWTGLLLIGLWLRRGGWPMAWLMFPAAYFSAVVWTVGWLWKDAALCSILALALGIACLGASYAGEQARLLSLAGVGLVLAVGATVSWFMLPTLLVAALALAIFPLRAIERRARGWLAPIAIVLAPFALVMGTWTLVREAVIQPTPQYQEALPLMLDLARIECAIGTPADRAAGRSLFPDTLIRPAEGHDICDNFTPFDATPMFQFRNRATAPWVVPVDNPAHFVEPGTKAELEELRGTWRAAVIAHPQIIAEAKLRQALQFLTSVEGIWWSPSRQLQAGNPISVPGGFGQGSEVAWPSSGRLVTAIAATPSAVASALLLDFGSARAGLLWILLAPMAAVGILWLLRSKRPVGFSWVPLIVPACWLLNYSLVAPAQDLRYMAPAIVWSQLALLILVFSVIRQRDDPDTALGGPKLSAA